MIDSISTGDLLVNGPELICGTDGYLTVKASADHSLASIGVVIAGFGIDEEKPFSCSNDPVVLGSLTIHINCPPETEFAIGTATVTDCCGNKTTKQFSIGIIENGFSNEVGT